MCVMFFLFYDTATTEIYTYCDTLSRHDAHPIYEERRNNRMSMAVGDRDENEPMMDMNTTPLIDVMLVLLIMFIITIPVQTHAVKIDLPVPTDSQSNVDPEKNKVMIDTAGTITWNGTPVDLAQLAQSLEQTKAMPVEPELQVQPDRSEEHTSELQSLMRNSY